MKQGTRKSGAACIMAGIIYLVGAVSVFALPTAPVEGHLRAAIRQYAAGAMAVPPDAVRVELSGRTPVDSALFKPGVAFEVESRSSGSPVGSVWFTIRLFTGGRFFKEETVQATVEVLHDFVVSARPLDRDACIGNDDIRIVQKWVKRMPANTLTDTGEAIGKRTCTSVRAGTELTRSMLREMVVVKKGKGVRIELEQGPLFVTAVGTSEENGTIGNLVRVRNTSSNRIIWARVIGEAAVRVEF
jgi:flagella basal body P-ring formation protein FlgA